MKLLSYVVFFLIFVSCSQRINSSYCKNEYALWNDNVGYRLSDSTYCIYYVDSVPYQKDYNILYSTKTGYTYISVDSFCFAGLKESDILKNNISNLLVMHCSYLFNYGYERKIKLFGNDDVNNSKLKVAESNNYGLCKCFYESNPNYFRVILIRGDYLENNLHYYRPDGRYKWPLNVLDLSAYYKVYVPIWE